MRLATVGLAAGLMVAAGAVTVPERAEAGRSVGVYTPYFSFYVGPRYKKRYYGRPYYYKKRYKRRYYGRPYYYRYPYRTHRHYYYRRW